MSQKTPRPNLFISVEGSEGAGKSTNIEQLEDALASRQLDFFVTREPGGTEMAEQIRALILDNRTEPVAPITELLLMFAARAQHVNEVIRPRLAAGQWVICDRFVDASYAYQGYARGVELEIIEHLEQWVVGETVPGLTLYLDLDPHEGAARIASRAKDRVEQEQASFFAAVREGYLARAKALKRIRLVDAGRPLEEVQGSVRNIVNDYIDRQVLSI